ncbi:hypothetical protein [Actinomadura macrotermitis]|uniref:Uncharacterized protein n=1 Tax=Actinomadura macrotermitis TaxID=2585200 RepID=A0A7K0BUI0_9ACTN|nr:hypothetical protein [Actinomadura macrotermitis]MQY04848.1 hypothetical protein [Actinomadura macrotermitis]
MRTRSLALVVPALVLAMGACGQEPAPGPLAATTAPTTAPGTPTAAPAPTSAEPRAKATPARTKAPSRRPAPTRKPALAGPGTNCGFIQPPPKSGPMAVVAVWKGRANCAKAVQIFRTYYRTSTPKQGSAGVATVSGWLCISNTLAETTTSGRFSTCRKGTAEIVADVLP